MFSLQRCYRIARGRVAHRRIYRSWLDVLKAIYLRLATKDRPGLSRRATTIGLRNVAGPAHVRAGDSDFLVLQEIFEDGEYHPILKWDLPSNARIFDLGGNIGLSAKYFASVLREAQILLVEPDHENCALAAKNCAQLMKQGKMQIIEAFASDHDGVARMNRDSRSWAFKKGDTFAAPSGDDHDETVDCLSPATLISRSGFDRIDLLKCDVEGTEAELFANCKPWIKSVSHLVVETHAPFRNTDLYAQLSAANWNFDVNYELQQDRVGLCFLKQRTASIAI